jgi:hypothetical protein
MRYHNLLLFFLIVAIMLCSCNRTDPSEYEKASGMAIPSSAVEKESHDDGKLVKISSFQTEDNQLAELVTEQHFSPLTKEKLSQFWGMAYLQDKRPFSNLEGVHYKSGTSGSVSWMYIADLKSRMLWTEIKYQGKPSY